MAQRFILPIQYAYNAQGIPLEGATLTLYESGGTEVLCCPYSDSNLTIPRENPITADSDGNFGDIFLDVGNYNIILSDKNGNEIFSADPYIIKSKIINATATLGVNVQTGTSYTVLSTDKEKIVSFNNASSVAVTLPVFSAGHYGSFQNLGAGAVTITPASGTIDGAANYVLNQYDGITYVSDGTNYYVVQALAGKVNTAKFADNSVTIDKIDDTVAGFSSASGAPGSTPRSTGDLYLDTASKNVYLALGASSSADFNSTNSTEKLSHVSGGILNFDNSELLFISVRFPYSCYIYRIGFYVRSAKTSGQGVVMGLYSDSSGNPGSKLAQTLEFTTALVSPDDALIPRYISLSAPYKVTADTKYWVCLSSQQNAVAFAKSSNILQPGNPVKKTLTYTYSATLPSTATINASSTNDVFCYIFT